MPKQSLTTEQAMRYSRQISLSGFDLDKQETLLNSNVLQVGVGGLGCAAAQYLVASGLGKLTLVDDDKVDKTNLQRQVLHTEENVGINKCVSAKASLNRLNSECKIELIQERLTLESCLTQLQTHHMVLDCTDNLATRNLLNQACYQAGIPLISGAAIRMEGQLMSVIPAQHSACYACVSAYFSAQELTCVESGVMSPLVGVIGAMQALEAIKVLCDYGQKTTNKLMMFDGLTGTWQTYQVPKRKGCRVCDSSVF